MPRAAWRLAGPRRCERFRRRPSERITPIINVTVTREHQDRANDSTALPGLFWLGPFATGALPATAIIPSKNMLALFYAGLLLAATTEHHSAPSSAPVSASMSSAMSGQGWEVEFFSKFSRLAGAHKVPKSGPSSRVTIVSKFTGYLVQVHGLANP